MEDSFLVEQLFEWLILEFSAIVTTKTSDVSASLICNNCHKVLEMPQNFVFGFHKVHCSVAACFILEAEIVFVTTNTLDTDGSTDIRMDVLSW